MRLGRTDIRSGVRERIARTLGEPDLEEVQLDSTSIKAHPTASTGRRGPQEKKKTPTAGVAWDEVAADGRRSCTPPSTAADDS